MKTNAYKVVAGIALCVLLLSALLLQAWSSYLDSPLPGSQEEQIVLIEQGASLSAIAKQLHELGVWPHPRLMTIYQRLFHSGVFLKAGEFVIPADATPRRILNILKSGEVVQYRITLIEGDTLDDVLRRIAAHSQLIHTLPAGVYSRYNQKPLQKMLVAGTDVAGADVKSLEGWLFPDTYYFNRGDTDLDILQRAFDRSRVVLANEWADRSPGLPYQNPEEALVMASLVEKETGVAKERRRIAGVFVRRLQLRMRLQTDPTVIYGMGKSYNGNLRKRDLQADTPYNTYRRHGLPPTPIAMPGREAIHAALHPLEGDELYFVAKGDGSHYFSKTLEEHQQAVQHYQINQRRSDYQSSPTTRASAADKIPSAEEADRQSL